MKLHVSKGKLEVNPVVRNQEQFVPGRKGAHACKVLSRGCIMQLAWE